MLGTIVNTICIVIGSAAGSIMRRRIDSTIQTALFNAMGIVTLALGANMAVQNLPKSQYPVLFIVSIALGSVIGFKLDIAGTLSIVGPVLSAVYGNNTYLYTNATLDLVSSAVFAATYGWGIMLGALVLFCWQGSIYAVAYFLNSSDFIPETLMAELSIVGGLLLISSGLAILNIKDCKTVNMLPALAFPVLFYIIKSFI